MLCLQRPSDLVLRSQSCEMCRTIPFGDEDDQVPHPKVLKSILGLDCEPEWFLAKSHLGSSPRALLGTDVCCAGSSDEQGCLDFIWRSLLGQ